MCGKNNYNCCRILKDILHSRTRNGILDGLTESHHFEPREVSATLNYELTRRRRDVLLQLEPLKLFNATEMFVSL